MKYHVFVNILYRVNVGSDVELSREQILNHIAEEVDITQCKLIDVDYENDVYYMICEDEQA